MKVLIGCEYSGVVRRAFRALGHDAWSCDILPAEDDSPYHYRGDIWLMGAFYQHWDLAIFHPPCTYLCSSGLHWNKRRPGREALTEEAIQFVKDLWNLFPADRIAIENPIGCLSTRFRKPDQIIQPWQFGEPYSKATCLWLKNLPLLEPTNILTATKFSAKGRPLWDNQTPSGQNKLGPSERRGLERARTYPGIAGAFAKSWGLTPAEVGSRT